MATRVLVVDDHSEFRHQVRLMLEEAGYAVIGEAADAETAIAACRRLSPDVVLLDVGLPDRDGFFVAGEVGAGEASPAVVLVSARDRSVYGSQASACGALGFLAKSDLTAESLGDLLGGAG